MFTGCSCEQAKWGRVELVPLRAVPCKTLGCNLYAGHDGRCSRLRGLSSVMNARVDECAGCVAQVCPFTDAVSDGGGRIESSSSVSDFTLAGPCSNAVSGKRARVPNRRIPDQDTDAEGRRHNAG